MVPRPNSEHDVIISIKRFYDVSNKFFLVYSINTIPYCTLNVRFFLKSALRNCYIPVKSALKLECIEAVASLCILRGRKIYLYFF